MARKNSNVTRAKESTTKKTENPKTKKPSPLFSSSTDSDTDLFRVTSSSSTKKPQALSTTEPKKKKPLFEDSSDDLFKPSESTQQVDNPLMTGNSKPEKPAAEEKSLFEDSSDDLFQPKGSEKTWLKAKAGNNQMLFNPGALTNSKLFNKLKQKSESDDDDFSAENGPKPVTAIAEEAVKKKSLLSESDENVFGESEAKIIRQKTLVKNSRLNDETKTIDSTKTPDLFGSDDEIFGDKIVSLRDIFGVL